MSHTKKLTTQEIDNIKYWLSKGLSRDDVSTITGRSITTVRRIANGTYYTEKEQKRLAQRQKIAEAKSSEEPEVEQSGATVCTQLDEITALLKAQNELLKQLIDLWR